VLKRHARQQATAVSRQENQMIVYYTIFNNQQDILFFIDI